MKKKNDELVPIDSFFTDIDINGRRGVFEEGIDGMGHPYEKKYDENGLYTKKEILKDGTKKITMKKKP